jgi:hypothetical protein
LRIRCAGKAETAALPGEIGKPERDRVHIFGVQNRDILRRDDAGQKAVADALNDPDAPSPDIQKRRPGARRQADQYRDLVGKILRESAHCLIGAG